MVMAGASVRLNTLWLWQRASAAPLTRESGSSSRHRGSFLLDSTRHRDTCSTDIATAFRYSGGIPSSATRACTHASRTAARHGALLLYLLTCLVNRLRPHTKHNTWGLRGNPAGCTGHRDACGAVIATPSRLSRPPSHQGAGYGLLVLHGHAIACVPRCRPSPYAAPVCSRRLVHACCVPRRRIRRMPRRTGSTVP